MSPTVSPGLIVAQRDHVVGADDEHALHPLDFLDRSLRHQDGVLRHIDGRTHASELARAQLPGGLGNSLMIVERAGLQVDRTVDDDDLALVREHAAIGEHQLEP